MRTAQEALEEFGWIVGGTKRPHSTGEVIRTTGYECFGIENDTKVVIIGPASREEVFKFEKFIGKGFRTDRPYKYKAIAE